MNTEKWNCPHCGSDKGAWFSRTIPMGNFCESCGECVDNQPEQKPESPDATPRTDEYHSQVNRAVRATQDDTLAEGRAWNFARQLERENNALVKEVERLKGWLETETMNRDEFEKLRAQIEILKNK